VRAIGEPTPDAGPATYDIEVDLDNPNMSQTHVVLLTGEGKDVLEVGTATGATTRVLKERGCRVTGVEVDPDAAERARPHCERMLVGDIEAMDLAEAFGAQRFDVIIFADVLEHLVHPERILADVRGLLSADGAVVASIPNVAHASVRLALLAGRFDYTDRGLLDRTHLRFYTRGTVDELFRDTGYAIERWERVALDVVDSDVEVRSDEIPPAIVRRVVAEPDALTYQFVVRARPGVGPALEPPVGPPLAALWDLREPGPARRAARRLASVRRREGWRGIARRAATPWRWLPGLLRGRVGR
jgi:2-polyprenyl-3-methyl-5-hydroxy-6-metoxy-1,4-benzoquinol methylase